VNSDYPMLARVRYLVITELAIATLFAHVFVMRHQCHAVGFFAFPGGSHVAS
jgi:hypothetical protein